MLKLLKQVNSLGRLHSNLLYMIDQFKLIPYSASLKVWKKHTLLINLSKIIFDKIIIIFENYVPLCVFCRIVWIMRSKLNYAILHPCIIPEALTSAWSHNSEDMIELSFLKWIQNMNFLHQFSVTTSPVFCIFFFPKCSLKLGCILYMDAHYTQVNTVVKNYCN